MRTALYLQDGTQVSKDAIRQAVAEHRAVVRWGHGNWENVATLLILEDAEDAAMEASRNTIGQCYSMSDECWSNYPTSVGEAVRAAAGLLKTS